MFSLDEIEDAPRRRRGDPGAWIKYQPTDIVRLVDILKVRQVPENTDIKLIFS